MNGGGFMTDNSLKLPSLPTGFITIVDGPKQIFRQMFPVRFNPLNAAVRSHLSSFVMQDMRYVCIEETAGFVRYKVSFKEFDIGVIRLQELPDGQSTELSIIPPLVSSELTNEERMIIDLQPDRDSKKKVITEMATQNYEQREKTRYWQGYVFNIFLPQFLSDPVIEEANSRSNQELFVDDIYSFCQVKNVEPRSIKNYVPLKLYEDYIQTCFEEIIGEKFHQVDGPHETSDLRSSFLEIFRGKRCRAAFLLKGQGTKGKLTHKKCGANGDQIVKLMDTPADLYVI